nr:hypothetical protein [uncultured Cohaesibacter sp.]
MYSRERVFPRIALVPIARDIAILDKLEQSVWHGSNSRSPFMEDQDTGTASNPIGSPQVKGDLKDQPRGKKSSFLVSGKRVATAPFR